VVLSVGHESASNVGFGFRAGPECGGDDNGPGAIVGVGAEWTDHRFEQRAISETCQAVAGIGACEGGEGVMEGLRVRG